MDNNFSAKLYQKINACMSEIRRVAKNGRNDFHRYDYATESDILETVRPIMVKHNLHIGFDVTDVRENHKNEKQIITVALMVVTVTDCETGYSEKHQWAGSGEDSGDKGLYKAMTGGQKYFLMKFFSIPTGDDPESDGTPPRGGNGKENPADEITRKLQSMPPKVSDACRAKKMSRGSVIAMCEALAWNWDKIAQEVQQ